MKLSKVALASISIILAVSSVGCSNSSAACAEMGSSIRVQPERVSSDGELVVSGEGFGELVECDDAGFDPQGAEYEPLDEISVELHQGSQEWRLATVEASEENAFEEDLSVPNEVAPGDATVTATGNQGTVRAPISVVN